MKINLLYNMLRIHMIEEFMRNGARDTYRDILLIKKFWEFEMLRVIKKFFDRVICD